jgi:hypothetical protein
LIQDSFLAGEATSYQIEFEPANPLPSTGSIKLVYPEQIQPKDGVDTDCFVKTNKKYTDKCTIDLDTRSIIIKDAFDWQGDD